MPKRAQAEKEAAPFDLRAARESKNMTQKQAADMFFAGQSSIARWESDGTLPRIYREYWSLYWRIHKPVQKKAAPKQQKESSNV